jgi:hypothetical protein
MEHWSFHDTKLNWSEELLMGIIVLTTIGNIWGAFAGPTTDRLIAGGMAIMALLILLWFVWFVLAKGYRPRWGIGIAMFLMMLNLVGNAKNLYDAGKLQGFLSAPRQQ